MTASAADAWLRSVRSGVALVALGLAIGCAGSAPAPVDPFQPLPTRGAYMPDEIDRGLRKVAGAILREDPFAARLAAAEIETHEILRDARGEGGPTGALPYALDATNSLLDRRGYQRGSRALLERDDLRPELRSRLEATVEDDPIRLANARLRDEWQRRYGRMFNMVIEPIGRSMGNLTLLPYKIAFALVNLVVIEHLDDDFSLPERQALVHWKRFIEAHPESPEALDLLERVQESQREWYATQRLRTLRQADLALSRGDAPLARLMAQRTLRYVPEDPDAADLLARAREAESEWRDERARSLGGTNLDPEDDAEERRLALALLGDAPGSLTLEAQGPEAVRLAAAQLIEADPKGPLADEALFALATEYGEDASGADEMWEALEAIGEERAERSNMARHARSLDLDIRRNAYDAWRTTLRQQHYDRARWLFLGPLQGGVRERFLPRPLEWLLEAPALIQVVSGFPNRLLRTPWYKNPRRSPGVLARRYLEQSPDGDFAEEVRDWLVDYEEDRGNAVGAYRLAQHETESDPERIAKLREKAAVQALEAAQREKRFEVRIGMLRAVGREFAGTEAGQDAVRVLRDSMREATAQQIRISKGFLEENPEIAGPRGLALQPALLDGEDRNGELHPKGVTLLGATGIELAYLDQSGDPRDPPVIDRRRISSERTSRLVALLEEVSLHGARTDRDFPVEFDADRDLFFEQVRLGVDAESKPRMGARSTYSFIGQRERYGLVRSRDPILPVELVLQGSFDDLSMGAFPRIRTPKPTADAFLYED